MKKKSPTKTPTRRPSSPNIVCTSDERQRLITAFGIIRGHALEMAGKTARVYDKTDPIVRTCESMLAQLGAPVEKPAEPRRAGDLPGPAEDDFGQGDGCEGGKCAVPK